jgi:hypothetical protein
MADRENGAIDEIRPVASHFYTLRSREAAGVGSIGVERLNQSYKGGADTEALKVEDRDRKSKQVRATSMCGAFALSWLLLIPQRSSRAGDCYGSLISRLESFTETSAQARSTCTLRLSPQIHRTMTCLGRFLLSSGPFQL